MRKKIREKSPGKFFIVTAAIIAMNFLGISYAYWSDDLRVHTQWTTSIGNIDPSFREDYSIGGIEGTGELSVRFEDEYTMVIEGQVETGYTAFLNYHVINKGSVPVKYENPGYYRMDGTLLAINQNGSVLRPVEENNQGGYGPSLHIQAQNEGWYRLSLGLPFRQWVER